MGEKQKKEKYGGKEKEKQTNITEMWKIQRRMRIRK